MIPLAKMRRTGGWLLPWLLGLYLVAQVAGIVPLFGVHFQHVLAGQQDIADDLGNGVAPDHVHHHHSHRPGGGVGQHDHGADDPGDQCCTLHHHLAGVLPGITDARTEGVPVTSIVASAPRSLAGSGPALPERPPKLRSSV